MIMKILFVLPGRVRSGGVRVTIDMANQLLKRGHQARIAYKETRKLSLRLLKWKAQSLLLRTLGVTHTDWIDRFEGEWLPFEDLNEIQIQKDEIVIAVGVSTVADVVNLRAPCVRFRYNHGLRPDAPENMKAAFGFPMPTLTVSHSIVPSLKAQSGETIIPVVPNGLYTEEYFVTDVRRDGIGSIYDPTPLKGPDIVESLLRQTSQKWPQVPWYLFGPGAPPPAPPAASVHFKRFPSVEEACDTYNRCMIWLCPSRLEGLPAPILEAMACGCAVISTTTDGGRELIESGVNGLHVPIDDTAAFMDAIDRLLHDEPFRRKIVENGRATVAKFTWERSVEKMEKCLEDLLTNGRFTRESE